MQVQPQPPDTFTRNTHLRFSAQTPDNTAILSSPYTHFVIDSDRDAYGALKLGPLLSRADFLGAFPIFNQYPHLIRHIPSASIRALWFKPAKADIVDRLYYVPRPYGVTINGKHIFADVQMDIYQQRVSYQPNTFYKDKLDRLFSGIFTYAIPQTLQSNVSMNTPQDATTAKAFTLRKETGKGFIPTNPEQRLSLPDVSFYQGDISPRKFVYGGRLLQLMSEKATWKAEQLITPAANPQTDPSPFKEVRLDWMRFCKHVAPTDTLFAQVLPYVAPNKQTAEVRVAYYFKDGENANQLACIGFFTFVAANGKTFIRSDESYNKPYANQTDLRQKTFHTEKKALLPSLTNA